MARLETGNTLVMKSSAAPKDAKLELAEYLLSHDDPAECAQRCVDWAAKYIGARRVLCLVVDAEARRLNGLAGSRMPAAEVYEFSLDLESSEHPLAEALNRT